MYICIYIYIYIYINDERIYNYDFVLLLRVSCLTQSFSQLNKEILKRTSKISKIILGKISWSLKE